MTADNQAGARANNQAGAQANNQAREEILRRVRAALAGGHGGPAAHAASGPPDPSAIPRGYLTAHAARTDRERADLLAVHLSDYRAHVHRVDTAALPGRIAQLLTARASRTVIAPDGLPPLWLTALSSSGAEVVADTGALTPAGLDAVDSVVTGCALAIAETGTIVLDAGPGQGQRRLTLVPDHHICVIQAPAQVVDSLPQALPRLDPARPLTWISGPSATSDIELDRVEGVHGPRTLDVIIVQDDGAGQDGTTRG